MLVLSNNDLVGLLPPLDILAAVEEAVRALDAGKAIAPKRQHVEWDGNTLLTMPAVGAGWLGTKLVSVAPGNSARGLPVTNGVMILNDGATGLALAALNAEALTAQRTGAVGALGVKYMTPPDITSVGIVGCGVQGAWQAIFVCHVRPVREVFAVCRSAEQFEKFAATVHRHAPRAQVSRCQDARELLTRTRLVIAATSSSEPVLPDEPALLEGGHFIGVGAYRRTMQELPDSVFRLAGELAIDSEAARHEVGDIIRPVEAGILKDSDVLYIGEWVLGRRKAIGGRTTAYKSAGMALYDLFVAQAFYRAARSRNLGCEVPL